MLLASWARVAIMNCVMISHLSLGASQVIPPSSITRAPRATSPSSSSAAQTPFIPGLQPANARAPHQSPAKTSAPSASMLPSQPPKAAAAAPAPLPPSPPLNAPATKGPVYSSPLSPLAFPQGDKGPVSSAPLTAPTSSQGAKGPVSSAPLTAPSSPQEAKKPGPAAPPPSAKIGFSPADTLLPSTSSSGSGTPPPPTPARARAPAPAAAPAAARSPAQAHAPASARAPAPASTGSSPSSAPLPAASNSSQPPSPPSVNGWLSHGTNEKNRRWAEDETLISPDSASSLKLRWKFPTKGDVTCTPAVYKGVVYVPDWSGNLYAINASSGKTVWTKSFSEDYGFPPKTFSRATPAVGRLADSATLKEEVLVVGVTLPAVVIAVKLEDGTLVWNTTVDPLPLSKVIGGPSVSWGAVYVGVSSDEEKAAANASYPCCSFVGSVAKLDLATGQLYWNAFTLPLNQSYAGGAVWAANPAVDNFRGDVYTGTGNMYLRPPEVQQCVDQNPNRTVPDPCIFPGNHQDSVIGLNTTDGSYQWYTSLDQVDAWTVACTTGQPNPNCPSDHGEDYDFGMSPLLITIDDPRPGKIGKSVDVAVIGQKSGIVYALDRDRGGIVWINKPGPAGNLGGTSWGMASDGDRVYLGNMNTDKKPFYLPNKKTAITTGAWVALNASTGQPLWAFPNSNPSPSWAMMPSVANGVVFVGSADPKGHVYALDAKTGYPLWNFSAGATIYGGVAIDDGCIFFGDGYGAFSFAFNTTGGGPQNLYSFCVPHDQPPSAAPVAIPPISASGPSSTPASNAPSNGGSLAGAYDSPPIVPPTETPPPSKGASIGLHLTSIVLGLVVISSFLASP